jgi:hypothetical protein
MISSQFDVAFSRQVLYILTEVSNDPNVNIFRAKLYSQLDRECGNSTIRHNVTVIQFFTK